jgi:hypothetical protein
VHAFVCRSHVKSTTKGYSDLDIKVTALFQCMNKCLSKVALWLSFKKWPVYNHAVCTTGCTNMLTVCGLV